MIDLRSDTVTLPTKAMMHAISKAKLGDDVYGEDPTVNELEAHAANLLGLEAGLFVTSGTMGNLCAILTHCARGSRVIVGDQSHIFRYEAGGASALGGLMLHALRNTESGSLAVDELAEALLSPDDPHVAPAGLLALENTHNRCGGAVLDAATIRELVDRAHAHNVPVHIDGARLFNAAVALGTNASSLVAGADSVQICFSKGLSAPVGSMLLGSAPFIAKARRARKMLGGGMRQAGIVAAACRVAIDRMVPRLADDHARARHLAEAISTAAAGALHVPEPPTNLVLVHAASNGTIAKLVSGLRSEGVLVSAVNDLRLRAALHAGVDDQDVERAAEAFRRVIRASA